jgi:pimeloyl-ACP methyl ester carboxylesterase
MFYCFHRFKTHNNEEPSVMNQHQKYGSIAIEEVDETVGQPKNDVITTKQTNKVVVFLKHHKPGLLLLAMTTLLVILSLSYFHKDGSEKPSSTLISQEHDENEALFYGEQLVDHFGDKPTEFWSHRYYVSTKHFGGAGHPILLVVGGEGSLDHGMLYPFVTNVLAERFGAAVVQPEHRFYGPYKPIQHATTDQLLKLLTPHQAMSDMIRLVHHHLRETEFKECSLDRSSPSYCPIITIGGSYPGFLSAMFRLVYPDIVDAAYASSAPLYMYAQMGDPNAYYDIVTEAAEHSSPGCPHSVKQTLLDVVDEIKAATSLDDAAVRVGICPDSIPKDVTQNSLGDALVTMTSYSFADYDMDYYPPGPDTGLSKICKLFQNPKLNSLDTMKSFFHSLLLQEVEEEDGCDMATVECTPKQERKEVRKETGGRNCFDISSQLGSDDDTEEEEDTDDDGKMWNFQTCTNLIFVIGFSETSMFATRNSTYEEQLEALKKDCYEQFGEGATPRPHELVEEWGFDDLVKQGATRILFTNGLEDMWSGGSILEDLSDSLLALNFENGAHHSDLSHQGPSDADTDDIKEGFIQIAAILENWLDEIRK